MKIEDLKRLKPGTRVTFTGVDPCNGWVCVCDQGGIMVGWDDGQYSAWSWDQLESGITDWHECIYDLMKGWVIL